MGMHDLRGIAVDKGERGTEDLVAAHYFIDAALENGDVQRPGDAEANGDIPSRITRTETIEIPQRLLRDGRGKRVLRIGEASPFVIGLALHELPFSQTT